MNFLSKGILVFGLVLGLTSCKSPHVRGKDVIESAIPGWTLFTPFREQDFPGSVFVFAKAFDGSSQEFTVSNYDRLFEGVDLDRILFEDRQLTTLFDQYSTSATSGLSLSLSAIQSIASLSFSHKFQQTVNVKLSQPHYIYRLTDERFIDNRPYLRDTVLAALRDRKERGQLQYTFIVMEAIQVAGVSVTVELKPEWNAGLSTVEIAELESLELSFNSENKSNFTLTMNSPTVIAYKAASIPESLLRTSISPADVEFEVIPSSILKAVKLP